MGIVNRIVNLFRTEHLNAEAQDELAFHLEQRIR